MKKLNKKRLRKLIKEEVSNISRSKRLDEDWSIDGISPLDFSEYTEPMFAYWNAMNDFAFELSSYIHRNYSVGPGWDRNMVSFENPRKGSRPIPEEVIFNFVVEEDSTGGIEVLEEIEKDIMNFSSARRLETFSEMDVSARHGSEFGGIPERTIQVIVRIFKR